MVDINDKSHISFQGAVDNSDMLVEKRISISPKKLFLVSNQEDSKCSAEFLESKLTYAHKIRYSLLHMTLPHCNLHCFVIGFLNCNYSLNS